MYNKDALDKAFWVVLIVKVLDGLLEIASGSLLLLVSQDRLVKLATSLTEGELSHDPHDFIAAHVLHSVQSLTAGGRLFAAVYLLSHGFVKVVLVVAVIRNKLWAYPWMMAFLGIFIVYQVYHLASSFGLGLLLLTIFDLVVLWLTYIEYQRHKHRQANTTVT